VASGDAITSGRAAEQAARQSYGRLVAYLARSWRDLAAIEDALGEAFARALAVWPRTGVPDSPDAWLLVAARNRLLDGARGSKVHAGAVASLLVTGPDEASEDAPAIPDKRLELMVVCANPAIDAAMHAPLMLQVVLGLSAADIASSFLVSPDTMGRRLGRAKARIRDAGLTFALPDRDDLPARMSSVMDAIYAAYGQGWDSIASDDASRRGLAEEAVWLARVLVALAPGNAEARGLLALMLFCETRTGARRAEGRYVPLAEQDLDRWDHLDVEVADLLAQRVAVHAQQLGGLDLVAAGRRERGRISKGISTSRGCGGRGRAAAGRRRSPEKCADRWRSTEPPACRRRPSAVSSRSRRLARARRR
jgi:RNA polymerase sigma-70 factor (ECF subfamily)